MATDNELFIILVSEIESAMTAKGVSVSVIQSFQQELQDVEVDDGSDDYEAQVYVHKLRDKRYGWKKQDDLYLDGGEYKTAYIQQMESTFQIQVLKRRDPNRIDQLTASDIRYEVSEVLQSPEFIDILWRDHKVGIERVIDLPDSYMIDDKDQYENAPNIEFTLTHKRVNVRDVPAVTSKEANIQRV